MRILRVFILSILISFTIYQNTFSQPKTELQKLVAHDRASTDFFGYSVSVNGDYAIVGAYNEDEDISGNHTVVNTGSVYIFERTSDGTWQQKTKLVASDRNPGDFFGISVSISGSYAIVGTQQDVEDESGDNTLSVAGSAYIFERDTDGNWPETARLLASDRASSDFFGDAVSIHGEYAVVGARAEDQDADGGNLIDNAGSAYIFKRANDGTWNEVTKLVASDRASYDNFGASVAIEGNCIIVGANQEDEDENGENTADGAGAAYVFERSADDSWTEVAKLVASDRASDDIFGFPVAISENKVVIGAHLEDEDAAGDNRISKAGAAYVFERSSDGNWSESAKLVASDRSFGSYFGISVDISGHYVVVGASDHEDAGVGVAGAAYVFRRTAAGEWLEDTQLLASDRDDTDEFGYAVAIDGSDVFIGANREDEDENNDNTASSAGSVYVYDLPLTQETVTQCDTYIFDNTTLTSSGTYSATLLNSADVDSLVTLNLTILNATSSEETVEVCESYDWNDMTYTQSGVYEELFTNAAGCDSTALLHLTISEPSSCVTLSTSNQINEIIVSPNPTKSIISVQGIRKNSRYYLRNVSGKVIQAGVISDSKLTVDAESGVYLLSILSINKTIRIIKID